MIVANHTRLATILSVDSTLRGRTSLGAHLQLAPCQCCVCVCLDVELLCVQLASTCQPLGWPACVAKHPSWIPGGRPAFCSPFSSCQKAERARAVRAKWRKMGPNQAGLWLADLHCSARDHWLKWAAHLQAKKRQRSRGKEAKRQRSKEAKRQRGKEEAHRRKLSRQVNAAGQHCAQLASRLCTHCKVECMRIQRATISTNFRSDFCPAGALWVLSLSLSLFFSLLSRWPAPSLHSATICRAAASWQAPLGLSWRPLGLSWRALLFIQSPFKVARSVNKARKKFNSFWATLLPLLLPPSPSPLGTIVGRDFITFAETANPSCRPRAARIISSSSPKGHTHTLSFLSFRSSVCAAPAGQQSNQKRPFAHH